MSKPIMLSDSNYEWLDKQRKTIPSPRKIEAFNEVISKIRKRLEPDSIPEPKPSPSQAPSTEQSAPPAA